MDAFPAEPLVDSGPTGGFDHVFGMNVFLPPGLEGEDISGWEERGGGTGLLDASRQLRYANHVELARRSKRRLGDALTLIEPVAYSELHGFAFYDLFLDRRKWPRLMRQGYEAATEALAPFVGAAPPELRPRSARADNHEREEERAMSALGNLLRWSCIAASGLVVLGFVLFAGDEIAKGSSHQVVEIEESGPVPAAPDEVEREEQESGFREFVNDANDVLLGPFDHVVSSSDAWLTRGVPALLAVLLYGLGGLVLLNYLLPARR